MCENKTKIFVLSNRAQNDIFQSLLQKKMITNEMLYEFSKQDVKISQAI